MRRNWQWDGQMLLEVLVALTVLVLVTVAVVGVSTRSLKSMRVAGNRQEALNLAKQVMVNIEKNKENDITGFFSGVNGTEDCSDVGYVCETTYVFATDKVEVKVLVTWQEGGRDSSVSLDKVFTKTRL